MVLRSSQWDMQRWTARRHKWPAPVGDLGQRASDGRTVPGFWLEEPKGCEEKEKVPGTN